MITLTQSIIDKLAAWEDAGHHLNIYWFPENTIVRETKTARDLCVGKEGYMISLGVQRAGGYWFIIVDQQWQAERDFDWLFAEDMHKCINKKGVA